MLDHWQYFRGGECLTTHHVTPVGAQGAYVLGTITLLVVKSDERTGRYRDMSAVLKEYIVVNEIPTVCVHQTCFQCCWLHAMIPDRLHNFTGWLPIYSHKCAQDLSDSMTAHLRLHFSNEEASDEQVTRCPNRCIGMGHTNAHAASSSPFL